MNDLAAAASGGNALLDAFPADIRERLQIETNHLDSHVIVAKADEAAEWLFFPHRGAVISLTRTSESGVTVEVGIVGPEGLVSMYGLLSAASTGADGIVQVGGVVSQVRAREIREAMASNAKVSELVLAAAGAFLLQVSQHALCNRLHTIEQRLAKWLLGVRDRIDIERVELTHDFLSHMLGIRRAGVTVAIGALALDGLIVNSRATITILDREGLESRSCECYRVMRDSTRQQFAQM